MYEQPPIEEQAPIQEETILALDMTSFATAIQALNKKVEEQGLIIQQLVLQIQSGS